jgi:hypothetical protein
VTINGQTVQVTVDPGSAVGAGTSESQATVTVQVLGAGGEVVSSVTYQGAGVTGVDLSGGSVQILTGNTPNSAPNDAPPPPVAVVSIDAGGNVTTQPTAVGFVLGVQPTATSGSVTPVAAPPATGDTTSTNSNAQEIVAAVLGITPEAAAGIISDVASSGGNAQTAAAAVITGVTNAGGDATQATAAQTGATGSTLSEVNQNNANNILNGALNQAVAGGGLQNQVNPPQVSP